MAKNIEEFIIVLRDRVSKKLGAAEAALEGVRNKAKKTESTFSKLTKTAGGVFAALGVATVGREVVNTLAEFEKFEAVLTNTLGSNSAAQAALQQIKDFAASTPFQVDGLTGAFVKLANQGFTPTVDEMRKLGDIAASTGKEFDQLAEAVIDAQTGEFERLKEFGIRASKEGDKVKFTFKGVETQTDFTADAMRAYILSLGDAAGVSGAMAAISKTTGGQISNLQDKITDLALKIGVALRPAITATISALAALVKWVGDNLDVIGTLATVIGIAALAWTAYNIPAGIAIVKTQLLTAAQWLLNAALTANPIGIVIGLLAALVAAFVIAWRHSEKFRGFMLGLWESIKQVFENLKNSFLEFPRIVIGAFAGIPKAIANTFSDVGSLFEAIFSGDFSAIPGILKSLGTNILKASPLTAPVVAVASKLGEGVGDAFNRGFAKGAEEVAEVAAPAVAAQKKAGGVTTSPSGKGKLKAGIAGVRAAAPKTFNINIDSLVKELSFETKNLTESAANTREVIAQALLSAVNDTTQIAR